MLLGDGLPSRLRDPRNRSLRPGDRTVVGEFLGRGNTVKLSNVKILYKILVCLMLLSAVVAGGVWYATSKMSEIDRMYSEMLDKDVQGIKAKGGEAVRDLLKKELAGRGRIEFSEALAHDFVGMLEASAIHSFLAQTANELNQQIKIRIQVGNFEAACRMIESNVGIGVVPYSAASRHAKSLRKVSKFFFEPSFCTRASMP